MLGGLLWGCWSPGGGRELPGRIETGRSQVSAFWAGGRGALPSSGAPHEWMQFSAEETWGICLLTEKWEPGAADSELLLGTD